jgi:hypothetical protein
MEPGSANKLEDSTLRPSYVRHGLRFISRFSILLIIICSVGFYELGRSAVYREHPELSGQEQASAILQKVGALIQLPSGEAPTMATINDATSAKKAQAFLKSAENGDVLIVYPNAAEALLYRPSTDKLIAVGPVNSNPGAGQGTEQIQTLPAPTASSTPRKDATTSTSTKK